MLSRLFSRDNLIVSFVFFLLSYPLFYFSYKFCLPEFGGEDYYAYLYLYESWNFDEVASPFNMRVISSYAIFLMNKIGFFYDTETVFAGYHPDLSLQVFFNAVFFNYLCVVATCVVVYHILLTTVGNNFYSFCGGCLYLLGYGTLFFSLKPLSDACGVLLMALTFYFYLRKDYWIFLVLLLSVLQREYIFIVCGIIACIDLYFSRNRYFLHVLIGSVFFFALYYVLRKTLFFTPHFESQTSPVSFAHSLLSPTIDWISFFKQTILLSNLLLFYAAVLVFKRSVGSPINNTYLIITVLLLVQVILMSIMARFGNNAGRYFYYTSPVIIFYLFTELKPLMSKYIYFKENV